MLRIPSLFYVLSSDAKHFVVAESRCLSDSDAFMRPLVAGLLLSRSFDPAVNSNVLTLRSCLTQKLSCTPAARTRTPFQHASVSRSQFWRRPCVGTVNSVKPDGSHGRARARADFAIFVVECSRLWIRLRMSASRVEWRNVKGSSQRSRACSMLWLRHP